MSEKLKQVVERVLEIVARGNAALLEMYWGIGKVIIDAAETDNVYAALVMDTLTAELRARGAMALSRSTLYKATQVARFITADELAQLSAAGCSYRSVIWLAQQRKVLSDDAKWKQLLEATLQGKDAMYTVAFSLELVGKERHRRMYAAYNPKTEMLSGRDLFMTARAAVRSAGKHCVAVPVMVPVT